MKADLKRVINFLIIVTTTIAVLVITFDCISMINDKSHTVSVFNLVTQPLMIIGFIDLLIFVPSILVFAFIYANKYNTNDVQANWTNDKTFAYAHKQS